MIDFDTRYEQQIRCDQRSQHGPDKGSKENPSSLQPRFEPALESGVLTKDIPPLTLERRDSRKFRHRPEHGD